MRSRLGRLAEIHGILVLILAAALALRVGYLLYYRSLPDWNLLTVDNYFHHHWAQSIASGNIFGDTTYFRAPFYVYCLGALYSVFGDSLWIGRLFGVVVGTATVLFAFLLGKRAFGHTTGLLAAGLVAVVPICVYFDGELLLDSLFTLLLLVSLHQFLRWYERQTLSSAYVTGLLLGLAAITRPTALVLAPVVIIFVLVSRERHIRLATTLVFVAGVMTLTTPIFIRNFVKANDPVFIASQSGINLYIGNNEAADGISAVMPEPLGHNWRLRDISYIAEKDMGRRLRPGEVSSYWTGRALKWMTGHPTDAVRLFIRKLYFSIGNREISNNRDLGEFFARVPFLHYHPLRFSLLLAFGLVGAILGFRRYAATRAIVVVIVCLILANSLYFVNSRFRLPLIPLLTLLTACAVVSLPELLRQNGRTRFGILGAGLGVFLISAIPLYSLPRGVDTQSLLRQARHSYVSRDYRTALRLSQQAARIDAAFPETNLNIGANFLRLGSADSATFYFGEEIRLHPDRPDAYANLGSVYLVNHKYAEARAVLQTALKMRPYDERAAILNIRAYCLDSALSVDSIREAVNKTTADAVDDLAVFNEAGAALTQLQLYAEAESLLTRAVSFLPPPIETDDEAFEESFANGPEAFNRRRSRAYMLLGYAYGRDRQLDFSIIASRTAIALDPSATEPYFNLISAYMAKGDTRAADSVLTAAESRFPDNDRFRILRQGPPR